MIISGFFYSWIMMIAGSVAVREGEYLVEWNKAEATRSVDRKENSETFAAFILLQDSQEIISIGSTSISKIQLSQDSRQESFLEKIKSVPGFVRIQPNYIYRMTSNKNPNDPYFTRGYQWTAKNYGQRMQSVETISEEWSSYDPTHDGGSSGIDLNLSRAWDLQTDCSSVPIAILDTGINYNHSDLRSNLWSGPYPYYLHGVDFVDSDNNPMDSSGHGTHIAGIIAAQGNNFSGGVGVCWKAKLMAVRTLNSLGEGSTASLLQGIDFAIQQGARIVNLSLGNYIYDPFLKQAFDRLKDSDILVVTAAGNDGINNDVKPLYPCNYRLPNMICVGAVDQAGDWAWFSNYGKQSVDIAAPGVNIFSTWAGDVELMDSKTNLSGQWTNSGVPVPSDWSQGIFNGRVALMNPPTYGGYISHYQPNSDDRVWKTFNFSSVHSAILNLVFSISMQPDMDIFSMCLKKTGGDCFRAGGQILFERSDIHSEDLEFYWDLSSLVGASSSSLGFRLKSNAFIEGQGVVIREMNIKTLTYATSRYNLLEGTSMAAPFATGIAALVWSRSPSLKSSEVVQSILNGGRSLDSLKTRTITGKMLDAEGALRMVSEPTP